MDGLLRINYWLQLQIKEWRLNVCFKKLPYQRQISLLRHR